LSRFLKNLVDEVASIVRDAGNSRVAGATLYCATCYLECDLYAEVIEVATRSLENISSSSVVFGTKQSLQTGIMCEHGSLPSRMAASINLENSQLERSSVDENFDRLLFNCNDNIGTMSEIGTEQVVLPMESTPAAPAVETGSPSDFLKQVVGQQVVVRLNSGVDYRGKGFLPVFCRAYLLTAVCGSIGVLSCLDGYMNIALEQTEEYVNGVLTNTYGDAFVRGNNGMLLFHATSGVQEQFDEGQQD
jgi:U6 snRNA-associated Sm-like protein LSm6